MVFYQPVQENDTQQAIAKISPEKMQVIRKLSWVVCLSFTFMIGQAVGGYLANSLAVMSDAAHLFSDVVGYALSLVAVYCSTWKSTPEMTFGFGRAEIFGAFLSVLFLWLVLYHLVLEAIERLSSPEAVDGPVMFGVSLAGLCVNLLMGFVLMYSGHGHSHGLRKCDCPGEEHSCDKDSSITQCHTPNCNHKDCGRDVGLGLGKSVGFGTSKMVPDPQLGFTDVELATPTAEADLTTPRSAQNHEINMNIRAAVIHIVADTFQAAGVVISSALIWYDPDRFALADPICTLVFSVVGFGCSLNIMSDIFNIFMLRTPKTIDVAELQKALFDLDARIMSVDNVRVWSLTMSDTIMTCDMQTRSNTLNTPAFIQSVKDTAKLFGITQVTCSVENHRTSSEKLRFGRNLKLATAAFTKI